MPDQAVLEQALKQIFAGINELRAALPGKAFTIDGRLVGDIGEAIAQRDYEVRLFDHLARDYDGVTPCGRRVQVKATFKESLTFHRVPDYYLGLKLYEDGRYEEIYNGPGQLIAERFQHRSGFAQQLLSFPIKTLRALSEQVPSDQRIARRP